MSKKTLIFTAIFCFVAGLAVAGLAALLRDISKESDIMCKEPALVYFGDEAVTDYVVVTHNVFAADDAVTRLKDLIETKTGVRIKSKLKGGDTANTIRLIVDKAYTGEKIIISDGKIILYGADSKDMVKTVNAFANAYLGFSFAGDEREHLLNTGDIYNLDNYFVSSTP